MPKAGEAVRARKAVAATRKRRANKIRRRMQRK
jgi:hypothetical protein